MSMTTNFNLDDMLETVRSFRGRVKNWKMLTHPDNVELIRKQLGTAVSPGKLSGVEFHSNSYLDKDKWSGRYILPDGKSVLPEDLTVPWGRFAEWTASDATYLLKRGIIKLEMEPLFYLLEDKPLFDVLTVPAFNPLLSSTY